MALAPRRARAQPHYLVFRRASAKVFGCFDLTEQKRADDSGLIERTATMVVTAYPSSLISGV